MTNRVKNIEDNQGAPQSWCVLPWTHVSITGAGMYRLCCHSSIGPNKGLITDGNGNNLHVTQATWNDVVNSDDMKTVRKEMLQGKWPDLCLRCKKEHDSGMVSRNIYERSSLADIETTNYPSFKKASALTDDDGSIRQEDFPVSFLDIRFGNLCNLKCVMCGVQNSNQWYDDYYAISGYTSYKDGDQRINLVRNAKGRFEPENNIYNWDDNPNLWNEINSRIKELRKIYIVGGEPLMIDAHYDFLQKCVDEGYATNLIIEYNSNITNIPQRAWNIWKHFKNVLIGVSIDGIGEVNDLIRFPSKWWKIEENLQKLTVEEGNYQIHIAFTLQLLNIWNLPETLEYFLEKNYNRVGPWPNKPLITHHPLHSPKHFDVNILPVEFKNKIIEKFDRYAEKFSSTDYQSLIGDSNQATWQQKTKHALEILDNYKKFMFQTNYTEDELNLYRKNCLHVLDTLDKTRKTEWKKTFPEVYTAIQEWYNL